MTLEEIFGEKGLLARRLKGYEPRPQQVQMARAVERAIREKSHLLVEAGTGVGKSLAYLIPFALWAIDGKERAVVSTYTKALQEQLVKKDLPFLRDILGVELRFALCLGSDNYLCRRRLAQVQQYGLFESREEIGELEKILSWQGKTAQGLRTEMEFEPSTRLWGKVCRESDLCLGKECAHIPECYYRQARQRALDTHILVINHHLYFANLAAAGHVLPEFHALVFDEAHELEEVATDYLGLKVSNFQLRYLLDSLLARRGDRGLLFRWRGAEVEKERAREQVEVVRETAQLFFSQMADRLKGKKSPWRMRRKEFLPNLLEEPLLQLGRALGRMEKTSKDEEEKCELQGHGERCYELASSLRIILQQEQEGCVYWAEAEGEGGRARYSLHLAPIDVSAKLKEAVFDRIHPTVLTSATLAVDRSFAFLRNRIGLEETEELLLDSPFDYAHQALLYLPPGLPDPGQDPDSHLREVIHQTRRLLEITRGRTFVLFTSYRMLEQVFEALSGVLQELRFFRQGEMPRYRLLEAFKEDPYSVLFGTSSFWQGVDVPGRALECVILAKLPFAVPDDPIVEAKIEHLTSQGQNPFLVFQVPHAVVLLRQGFGRLIRTRRDRGVVAVLDPRLQTRSYGRTFLRSLPSCPRTSSLDKVREFLWEKKR